MRLNVQDVEAIKPILIKYLNETFKIDIEHLTLFIKEDIFIEATLYYKGLKIQADAKIRPACLHGDLILDVLEGKARNKYLVFDLVDFLKPFVGENSVFRITGQKMIFCFDEFHLPIPLKQVSVMDDEIMIEI